MGNSYEIVAQATIDGATGRQSLSIFCSGRKSYCPFLGAGNYPAGGKSDGQQFEILGQKRRDSPWKKAEYAVRPDTRRPSFQPIRKKGIIVLVLIKLEKRGRPAGGDIGKKANKKEERS